ncbi:hypothetical protein [Paenibacillus glycinis]|uniref:Uncharacterized protein n=1 Tax=Paenibacillus glycinis TaxID=2697035 RepID=A0ABW9XRY6_9BACL|nr:hypothetical protein [Paenibacillus glycinis]NBD25233.1 hypothetical protein [Paenibacillus glycinis]
MLKPDPRHLSAGLGIIAACKARTGDIWEAHYGAAAIASYLFRRDNGLSAAAESAVANQTERMIAAHALRGDDHASITGSAGEMPRGDAEREIVQALGGTLDGLHWVGHNFIYSALAIAALRELGTWGTADDVGGIAALVRSFKGTIPGRSWIGFRVSEVKRLAREADSETEGIGSPTQLSGLVLTELAVFKRIYRAEAHHDLIGHTLTFSHALNLLHDCGYGDLFRAGLPQLLAMVKVLRASRELDMDGDVQLVSPVDRLPLRLAPRSDWLPTEEAYWTEDHAADDWDFGHAFKFPCSFYDHLRRAADFPRDAAVENFRYIVPAGC